MKKMNLNKGGDTTNITTEKKKVTTVQQPVDPRLAGKYNPTIRGSVKTNTVVIPKAKPEPLVDESKFKITNTGFYTTDDKGNRIYDENTYSSGSSKAKATKIKPNPTSIAKYEKGTKKMKLKSS